MTTRCETLRIMPRMAGVSSRTFEQWPDRATRDHAGTGGRRPEQHLRRAEEAHDLVRDRALDQRDLEQVALGAVGALADRLGHFVGLAEAGTDVTVLVTDHHERR